MGLKKTHIAVAALVVAIGIPFALGQTGVGEQQTQGGAPLAFLRTGSSISADDHYLYVLGNGQITRVDKSTGAAAGQLTPTGWSGQGSPAGAAGGTTNSTGGASGSKSGRSP